MKGKGYVALGVVFLLFAVWIATGAVSLGTYKTHGVANGSFLVYNPYVELYSLFFALAGGFLLFSVGRENAKTPLHSEQKNLIPSIENQHRSTSP